MEIKPRKKQAKKKPLPQTNAPMQAGFEKLFSPDEKKNRPPIVRTIVTREVDSAKKQDEQKSDVDMDSDEAQSDLDIVSAHLGMSASAGDSA